MTNFIWRVCGFLLYTVLAPFLIGHHAVVGRRDLGGVWPAIKDGFRILGSLYVDIWHHDFRSQDRMV